MVTFFKNSQYKKVFILGIVFIVFFVFTESGFSEERRSPFKNWFPVIKIETKENEEPLAFVEPEKTFDVSVYEVQGLIWATNKPKAIINNEIYNVGDRLGPAEITKIDKEGVTLIFDDKEYVVTTKQKINVMKSDLGNEEK